MVTVLLGDRKGEDQSDPGRKARGDGGRGWGDAALSQGCPEAPGAGRGRMQSPLQPLRGAWSCPHCDIRFLASRTVKTTNFCYFRPSRRRRCAVAALGTQCTTPRLKWSSLGHLSRGHRCLSLEVHMVTPGEAGGPSPGDQATYSSVHGNRRDSLTRHIGRWKTNLLYPRGKVSRDSRLLL